MVTVVTLLVTVVTGAVTGMVTLGGVTGGGLVTVLMAAAKWRVQKTTCRLAATHKCLAKRNKSRTGANATNNRSTGEKQ